MTVVKDHSYPESYTKIEQNLVQIQLLWGKNKGERGLGAEPMDYKGQRRIPGQEIRLNTYCQKNGQPSHTSPVPEIRDTLQKKTLENQLLNVKKQLTETERGLQNQWLLSTEVVLSGIQESKLFDIFDIEAYFGTASVFDRISIKM